MTYRLRLYYPVSPALSPQLSQVMGPGDPVNPNMATRRPTTTDHSPPVNEVSLDTPSAGYVKDKDSVLSSIPKFSGKPLHYFTWKDKFLMWLSLHDLDKYVDEDVLTKVQLNSSSNDRKKVEKKVFLYTTQAMPNNLASRLIALRTSHGLNGNFAIQWLDDEFKSVADSTVIQLDDQLNSFNISTDDDIFDKISLLDEIFLYYEKLQIPKSERQKCHILLNKLSSHFQDFRRQWTASNKLSKPNAYKNLKSSLIANAQYYKSTVLSTDTLFSSRKLKCFSCGGNHFRKDCRFRNFICKSCNKTGHLARVCRQKRNDRQKNSSTSTRNEHPLDSNSQQPVTFALNNTCNGHEDHWIVDSGASEHITCFRHLLYDVQEVNTIMKAANNQPIKCTLRGKVSTVITDVNGRTVPVIFEDVLYSSEINGSFLSTQALISKGASIQLAQERSVIFHRNYCFPLAPQGNLLILKTFPTVYSGSVFSVSLSLQDWHARLAHADKKEILRTAKVANNMVITENRDSNGCEICFQSKSKAQKTCSTNERHITRSTIAKNFLDRIGSDIIGPVSPKSISGHQYVLVLVDHATIYRWSFPLKERSDQSSALSKFTRLYSPKILRMDNAPENVSQACRESIPRDTTLEYTNPYHPEQNSLAETSIATLSADTRALLRESKLPSSFWTFAWRYATFIRNRITAHRLELTPLELAFGIRPDMKEILPFGCKAWVPVPKKLRQKLDDVAVPGIFLGYSENSPGVLVYDPKNQRVVSSPSAHFQTNVKGVFLLPVSITKPLPSVVPEQAIHSLQKMNTEPSTIQEALFLPDAQEWKAAILEELINHEKFKTFEIIKRKTAPEATVVGTTIVLKQKYAADGSKQKKKARLCAQGFSQQQGKDFEETYAPVASPLSIRIMLCLTALWTFTLRQYDVTSAYLHSKLSETLLARIPRGLGVKNGKLVISSNSRCKDHLLLLRKSIYGLKQSGRNWFALLSSLLLKFGYSQSKFDEAFFFIPNKSLIVCIVDDMLASFADPRFATSLEDFLTSNNIALKVKKQPDYFSGCNIYTTTQGIMFNQCKSISDIIEDFDMHSANPRPYPHHGSFLNDVVSSDATVNMNFPYRHAIGSLTWILLSRPDINMTVNVLSRFVNAPTNQHVNAVKQVVRYLKGTPNLSLLFKYGHSHDTVDLKLFVDSDFAGDISSRRSRYGFILMLNGAPISWTSTLQKSIAISTSDAEFFAMCEASYVLLKAIQLIKDLGCKFRDIPTMFCDNTSAISAVTSTNPRRSAKKHIDVRFCRIRELVNEQKLFKIIHVPSSGNLADMFTKPLIGKRFLTLRDEILFTSPDPTVSREEVCLRKMI